MSYDSSLVKWAPGICMYEYSLIFRGVLSYFQRVYSLLFRGGTLIFSGGVLSYFQGCTLECQLKRPRYRTASEDLSASHPFKIKGQFENCPCPLSKGTVCRFFRFHLCRLCITFVRCNALSYPQRENGLLKTHFARALPLTLVSM